MRVYKKRLPLGEPPYSLIPSLEGLYVRGQSARILLVIAEETRDLSSYQRWSGWLAWHLGEHTAAPDRRCQTHHQTKH